MLELAYPWVFLLLPAPVIALWLLPIYREPRRGLRLPFFDQVAQATGQTPAPSALVMRRGWFQWLIAVLVWGLTIGALARPQWVEEPIVRIDPARDLLLAVDLSGSMDTRDFVDPEGSRMDRLSAVKRVLGDFISRRAGDRLGLIVFGQAPYMQAPFTLDHDLVRLLLDESRVGMAGPQTMMGDAIGLAIKHFEHAETEKRVLILLTDGNDTGSRVPPGRAAEIAGERGIVIYTIGVGDPEAAGEAPLNVELLESIAEGTGGAFFRADDRGQLEDVAAAIDILEPSQVETLSYRPKLPLFFWPLGFAVGLVLLYSSAMAWVTRDA
jgi:Ca-activated chloride channel family protein